MKTDGSGLMQAIGFLTSRDVRIAGTWALNDTADDVLLAERGRVKSAFDRPTPYTQNAFMVVKARSGTLEAAVEERPSVGKRHFLKVQETGGPRAQTGFEVLLSRSLAYEGVIQSVMPADNARLDAYGNWSSGERNQVLSSLQAQRDGTANTTARSAKRNRGRATYFVPQRGLTPGIYKRSKDGDIGMVGFISAKVPVYQQRLGFFDTATDIWRRQLPGHMARTVGKMIEKRFGGAA